MIGIKIEKLEKSTVDLINESIYGLEFNNVIERNAIPIKFNSEFWFLTSLHNFEDYLQENLFFKVLTNISNKKISLEISNIISFQDLNYNPDFKYDCIYDIYLKIVIFKYNKKLNNYYEINNPIGFNCDYNNIIFKWTTSYNPIQELKNLDLVSKEYNYLWINEFISYPPIPYIIYKKENALNIIPYIGSVLEFEQEQKQEQKQNNNLNRIITEKKMVGMVGMVDDENIYCIPLLSIYKFFSQISNNNFTLFNVDFAFIKIYNKNTYGIFFNNNHYNNYQNHSNNELIRVPFIAKGTIILKIDEHEINSNGNIIYQLGGFNEFPLKSYIWFIKELEPSGFYNLNITELSNRYTKIKNSILNTISDNFIEIKISGDMIKSSNHQINIKNNSISGIMKPTLKLIKYKNILLFGLNEIILSSCFKSILYLEKYKKILNQIDKNKYLDILIGIELINRTNEKTILLPKIIIPNKYNNIDEIINLDKKIIKKIIKNLFKK